MGRSLTSSTAVLLAALLLVVLPSGSAGAQTPPEAVATAVQNAAANGVTSFVSVVDRNSGAVLAQTGNAGAQVASESIMKLFLAAYYLRLYGGQSATPQAVKDRLAYMLIYSDNDIASSIFTAGAIPTVANAYGLGSTINATDRVGHWGAARITAADMTTFLFRAAHDDQVGPWLIPVMAQTAPTGSGADAGFSQYFGMNALGGEHGSKQGWGCDSFWTNPQCAVHSVGYTDRYFVAVLQLGNGYPDPMRDTSTATARTVQASTTALVDGDFICDSDSGAVYRMAGGAPVYVSTWSAFGGPQACRVMSGAEISRLPMYPADGTFLRGTSTGAVYRIGGGAPVYVSTWAAFGGVQPATNVDEAAIDLAGSGWYSHLLYRPADGTFVRGSTTGAVYRMAGGAPVYVSTWAAFGGVQPATTIDEAAIDLIGSSDYYDHIAAKPVDGTFLRGTSTGAVYRIVAVPPSTSPPGPHSAASNPPPTSTRQPSTSPGPVGTPTCCTGPRTAPSSAAPAPARSTGSSAAPPSTSPPGPHSAASNPPPTSTRQPSTSPGPVGTRTCPSTPPTGRSCRAFRAARSTGSQAGLRYQSTVGIRTAECSPSPPSRSRLSTWLVPVGFTGISSTERSHARGTRGKGDRQPSCGASGPVIHCWVSASTVPSMRSRSTAAVTHGVNGESLASTR